MQGRMDRTIYRLDVRHDKRKDLMPKYLAWVSSCMVMSLTDKGKSYDLSYRCVEFAMSSRNVDFLVQ